MRDERNGVDRDRAEAPDGAEASGPAEAPGRAEAPGPADSTDLDRLELEPEWLRVLRHGYHAPPPGVPREEMWAVIEAGMRAGGVPGAEVVPLARYRRPMRVRWRMPAAWVAAAAVLAIGIGIGRWSAAGPGTAPAETPRAAVTAEAVPSAGLDRAAVRHLGRTESLLVSVRSDARAGRVDASVRPWATDLLVETRLLMDARAGSRDDVQRLLADLELVLMEVLGAVGGEGANPERRRTEMDLVVRSLEASDVLPRIRSRLPVAMSGA